MSNAIKSGKWQPIANGGQWKPIEKTHVGHSVEISVKDCDGCILFASWHIGMTKEAVEKTGLVSAAEETYLTNEGGQIDNPIRFRYIREDCLAASLKIATKAIEAAIDALEGSDNVLYDLKQSLQKIQATAECAQ